MVRDEHIGRATVFPDGDEVFHPTYEREGVAETSGIDRAVVVNHAGWIASLIVGVMATWSARFVMEADGMGYLDYSDRFLNGTWWSHPNGYWSPGFPVIVAMVRSIIGTGPAFDIPALHISYFLGYLASILSFSLLLYALRHPVQRTPARGESSESNTAGPDRQWNGHQAFWTPLLGWTLFLWASVALTKLTHVTPDSWVSAMLYLAVAAAVLVAKRRFVGLSVLLLGVALGVGFLVKAILLPVGVVLLGTLAVTQIVTASAFRWRPLGATVLAGVVFLLVSLPQIITQSRLAGTLTFGRTGTLVREWYVNERPCPLFGVPAAFEAWPTCIQPRPGSTDMIADQPLPRLFRHPSVYVFSTPPEATMAAWYDPMQWYPAFHATLDLHKQVVALIRNLAFDWSLLTPFIIAALAGGVTARRWPMRVRGGEPLLVVPAAGMFLLYALSYTNGRYLGPAVVLLVLGSASLHCRPRTAPVMSTAPAPSLWLTPALAAASCVLFLNSFLELSGLTLYSRKFTNTVLTTAGAVAAAGVRSGSRVGIIGDGSNAFWARQARLHIIAEIHPAEGIQYWDNTPAVQDSVIQAFRRAGARAIVASPVPLGLLKLPPGWIFAPGDPQLAVYRL